MTSVARPALVGMHRTSGTPLAGLDHLKQSITDILTTPLGSRVMLPEYGSNLPRMVDLPLNGGWIAAAQAESQRALAHWEPRVQLSQIQILSILDGKIDMQISGTYLGSDVVLQVSL